MSTNIINIACYILLQRYIDSNLLHIISLQKKILIFSGKIHKPNIELKFILACLLCIKLL